MLKLKVAVTGGISSGKSLVCHYFRELGAHVVSADEVVHQVLTPETEVGQKVIALLGNDILLDGQIDRQRISEKVFGADESLLASLEAAIHPAVRTSIDTQIHDSIEPVSVVEVPLLFEAGWDSDFDITIAVQANQKQCEKRYQELTGREADEYRLRMNRQLSPEEKISRADYVIENNGTRDDLKGQVVSLYKKWTM